MIHYKQYKPIALVADVPEDARHWRNLPEIWSKCRQNTLLSEADHAGWVQMQETSKTIKMFGIVALDKVKPEDSFYVGVCGFTSISHQNRNAEFSLYISPHYHKQGYGSKALETLLMHGFLDFGFKRIWGEVFEGNHAMKCFKKLGFTEEGVLRASYWKGGQYINSHMISLLNTEWRDIQEKKPKLESV